MPRRVGIPDSDRKERQGERKKTQRGRRKGRRDEGSILKLTTKDTAGACGQRKARGET